MGVRANAINHFYENFFQINNEREAFKSWASEGLLLKISINNSIPTNEILKILQFFDSLDYIKKSLVVDIPANARQNPEIEKILTENAFELDSFRISSI